MVRTAIVDDEEQDYQIIREYLEKFYSENGIEYEIVRFSEGVSFLSESGFDLVFLDIEMPLMNGIEVARKFREKDQSCALIFITNMIQYAIKGYEVDAIDYVVKPIQYTRFETLMKKTMRMIGENKKQEIVVKTKGGMTKIAVDSIRFIEIKDHLLIYDTDDGEVEVWGTLGGVLKSLPPKMFVRCSNSVIINVKKIVSIDRDEVVLEGVKRRIPISRSKKKNLISVFSNQGADN